MVAGLGSGSIGRCEGIMNTTGHDLPGEGLSICQSFEWIASEIPERECVVFGERRFCYAEIDERSGGLADFLLARGIGLRTDREHLNGWESGQDHVALYLYNSVEYAESMLGVYKARGVPVNVNYRYRHGELKHLLLDADVRAIIFHRDFSAELARVLPYLPNLRVLIQVNRAPRSGLLEGAFDYDDILAAGSDVDVKHAGSPDDLYMTYTGGTTGYPKGVLWRQGDAMTSMFSVTDPATGEPVTTRDGLLRKVRSGGAPRWMTNSPFMHVAGHTAVFACWFLGGTVVIPRESPEFDPDLALRTLAEERVDTCIIVGDAMAMPLIDQLTRKGYELSSLGLVISGGASLGTNNKARLQALISHVTIIEGFGSSETGPQAAALFNGADRSGAGYFMPGPRVAVLDAARQRALRPGEEEVGWFAVRGAIPLGYLNAPEKTRDVFREVEGTRYIIPGDRVRIAADGRLHLLGRDGTVINSGGEKIYTEEIEQLLKRIPGIHDALVLGCPHEKWGEEVCALVVSEAGADVGAAAIRDACRSALARYKSPRRICFVNAIPRIPNGKPDYASAKKLAAEAVQDLLSITSARTDEQ